jgi:hypothetical protein
VSADLKSLQKERKRQDKRQGTREKMTKKQGKHEGWKRTERQKGMKKNCQVNRGAINQ